MPKPRATNPYAKGDTLVSKDGRDSIVIIEVTSPTTVTYRWVKIGGKVIRPFGVSMGWCNHTGAVAYFTREGFKKS